MTRRGPSDLLPSLGLFEAHLEVCDLDRSIASYRDILGLELAHLLPERQVAFFWIGGPGHSTLVSPPAPSAPQSASAWQNQPSRHQPTNRRRQIPRALS
jgi:catechol 2,3-dioxygenase-like lactoylglutathione lyase family enzyme